MTIVKYVIGFVLSLVLTMTAYWVTVNGIDKTTLYLILAVLALVQMVVQLIFFLHLGEEARPRYKLATFLLMSFMLAIIVVGSIWIMDNMNYNMANMSPNEKNDYMLMQHDKGF
ncbi:MAG: cytochrome o ubiquinol oxidase subunit [Patescibacteria group bacterium]|nr:cytochrome o ubiquinol oxidase subunit [Patescibacteria group bacterium]